VTQTTQTYRWTPSEFLRAWEAGAFDHRVELVEGEVWPVVIGPWHGRASIRIIRLLPEDNAEITMATLPAGSSLPDPDCSVLRSGATPTRSLGRRLDAWSPEDVLLVVEVSDESVTADLTVKARIYGRAGFAVYWVVTPETIYEHTEPSGTGYLSRREYHRGTRIPVRYAGTDLAVDDLLGPADAG